MHRFITILLAILLSFGAGAQQTLQNGVNWDRYFFAGSMAIGKRLASTVAPASYAHTSAWLELGKDSTTKGFLGPRVVHLSDIAGPVPPGMMAYVYDSGTYCFHNGTAWRKLGSGAAASGGGTGVAKAYVDSAVGSLTPSSDKFYHVTIVGNSLGVQYGGAYLGKYLSDQLGSRFSVTIACYNGYTLTDIMNNFSTMVTANVDPSRENIFVFLEGANSFRYNGAFVADSALSYYLKAKLLGQQTKGLSHVSEAFFITCMPRDFHLEANVDRIAANKLLLDSLEKYYGIRTIDMARTPIGKFGGNNGNTGSNWKDPVRSSANLAYYIDGTHHTPRGTAILAATIADNILHVTRGSALPDREQYMTTLPTYGDYVQWKSKVYAWDTLIGMLTASANYSRAVSSQRITQTGSDIDGRFEFISQAVGTRVGFKNNNLDVADTFTQWGYGLFLNPNGYLDVYNGPDAVLPAITPWTFGDKIAMEVGPAGYKFYKNDLVIATISAAVSYPMQLAYSQQNSWLVGLREGKLSISPGQLSLPARQIAVGTGAGLAGTSGFTYDAPNNRLVISDGTCMTNSYHSLVMGFRSGITSTGLNNYIWGNDDSITAGAGTNNYILARNGKIISGTGGFVQGTGGIVSGSNGAATMNNGGNSSGPASLSINWLTWAGGLASFSRGLFTGAPGYGSAVGGYYDTSFGRYSEAGGWISNTNGWVSYAKGYNLRSPSFAEANFGMNNIRYTPSDSTAYAGTDVLFALGNGTSTVALSNALTIFKNGYIRVGTHSALTNKGGFQISSLPLILDSAAYNNSQDTVLVIGADGTIGKRKLPASGSSSLTTNTQTGTSYTITSADYGAKLLFTSSSPITVTIPAGLPVPFFCTVVQDGTGQITFAASSTTLKNPHSFTKTFGQAAQVSIHNLTTSNTYSICGDMQ